MVHRNEQLEEQLLEDLYTKDQGWVSAISDSELVILNLLIWQMQGMNGTQRAAVLYSGP